MVSWYIGMLLVRLGSYLVKVGIKLSGSRGYVDIKLERRILAEDAAVIGLYLVWAAMIVFMAFFVF
jgi:hypothetical protein